MSDNLGLFCSCAVLALMLLLGPGLSDARAQGQDDFEIPKNKDWVKASCKSKEMPKDGYDIAKRSPENNDCWWVKASRAQEIRSDIDSGTVSDEWRPERPEDLTFGPETTAQEAFGMARSKRDAAIQYINLQRQDAERTFVKEFSACGADVDCLYAAVTALGDRKAQLGARERDAERQLDNDIRRVAYYFTNRKKN